MSTSIEVAKQFSRAPVGRFISDGPNSGQRFRERFLAPALRRGETVIVDFRGTRAVGSSFLEEAFGGLIRGGFESSDLLRRISIIARDPSMDIEIKRYLAPTA